jgi:hypothetical protein
MLGTPPRRLPPQVARAVPDVLVVAYRGVFARMTAYRRGVIPSRRYVVS